MAADVGAGTGISTALLAARGCRVFALEPNRAMRDAARPDPLVTWSDAVAETTGLPPGSVGLVLCAQSFHWFEPHAALAEFHRILAPRGRLALLWNDRDVNDAATTEFSDAIRVACEDHPASRRHVRPEALFASKWFSNARTLRFRQVQRLDAEGLVGRAASASYVPKSGTAFDTLVRTLRSLPARYAGPDGRVDLVYVTHLHMAERAS